MAIREDTIEFLLEAIGVSVFVRPLSPGLTAAELRQTATLAGFRPGQIEDAISGLDHRTKVRNTGDRFVAQSTLIDADFHFRYDPDYRNPQAFHFVREHLKELVAEVGQSNARIEQSKLVDAGISKGLSRHDIEVAIACLRIIGIVELKGTIITPSPRNGIVPMPLTQVRQGPLSTYKRPLRAEAYECLRNALARSTETITPMQAIKIFISHSSEDAELAKALVACLEGCIDIPDGAILCTSVDGHGLAVGDDSGETLRDNLHKCSVVIGLLSESSLHSGWVIMELGAAWVLKKTICALLAQGVDYKRIPGPLSGNHAVRAFEIPGVTNLMSTVSGKLGYKMKNHTKVFSSVHSFVEVASRPAKPS